MLRYQVLEAHAGAEDAVPDGRLQAVEPEAPPAEDALAPGRPRRTDAAVDNWRTGTA